MTTQINVSKRELGLTFTGQDEAKVVVWAPHAEQVAIRVDGQPTPIALEKEAMEYWCVQTDQIKLGDL